MPESELSITVGSIDVPAQIIERFAYDKMFTKNFIIILQEQLGFVILSYNIYCLGLLLLTPDYHVIL